MGGERRARIEAERGRAVERSGRQRRRRRPGARRSRQCPPRMRRCPAPRRAQGPGPGRTHGWGRRVPVPLWVTVSSPPERISAGRWLAERQRGVRAGDLGRLPLDPVAKVDHRQTGSARRSHRAIERRAHCRSGGSAISRAVDRRAWGFRRASRAARSGAAPGWRAPPRWWWGRPRSGPRRWKPDRRPSTSERAKVSTRAGQAARARRPPLIALRCLRTVLSSATLAPLASRVSGERTEPVERQAGNGCSIRAEPPPERRQTTRSRFAKPTHRP